MADDDLQALIAAGPGGGAVGPQASRPRYIGGIPDDYVAPGDPKIPGYIKTQGIVSQRAPIRYVEGTQYGPRGLSSETIWELQKAMAQAGLIGPKTSFIRGRWDAVSSSAYERVLAYANEGGINADQALQELVNSPRTFGDGSEGGLGEQGKVQRATDAVTIEEQVQQAARQRLGRKLKASEVSKFVSIYQGLEGNVNAAERDAYDNADGGADTTFTDAPTVDVAASQFIDADYATEEASVDTLGYLGALESMLGG